MRNSDKALIIGEVGQNHQGNFETALDYISIFSSQGADVIKFQTRDNRYLFSEDAYNKDYNSENAFAKNYGEHREFLELDKAKLSLLKRKCDECGVKFMSTPFDEPSLDLICEAGVDIIKIASFDLGNIPFLTKISENPKKLIAKSYSPSISGIKGVRYLCVYCCFIHTLSFLFLSLA